MGPFNEVYMHVVILQYRQPRGQACQPCMLCTGRKGSVLLCNFLALVAAACGATLGACVQYDS